MPTLIEYEGSRIDADWHLNELERVECEESLATFLRYAWRFIDPAPYVHGWVIDALAEHLEAVADGEIKRLLINIPPRMGKPVSADTLVSTYERGLVELRHVREGEHVLTHLARFRRVTEIHKQGVIPVLHLKTRRGREIVAAPDHPFLTPMGWTELQSISKEDVIGLIPQRGSSGSPSITPEVARLLGYLIGDGNCQGTPNITVADDIEATDIHLVISAAGFQGTDQAYEMAKTGGILRRIALRALPGTMRRPNKNDVGPVRKFMERHKLWGGNSYTKMIPQAVLEGTNEIAQHFIGAFWACDGFVSFKGAKRNGSQRDDLHIGCDSVNKAFLLQMQTLLLRLGIDSILRQKTSAIKTKIQGDTYTSYSLSISDQDNCWRFANLIDIHHKKNDRLAFARRRRFDFDHLVVGDVVENIEDAGTAECICLTVDEDHSFVANGFAVHNSSIVSVAFPAWVWAQSFRGPTSGPGVPFLHASYAYSLAIRDSVKRRRLMKSTWYRRKWGDRFHILPEQDQKVRFSNSEGGESLITAVEAGVTGEGASVIIVDDANNAREVLSEAIIQSTNEDWWDGAMSTRLNDPRTGAIVAVQQRLGELDLSGHILAKEPERWQHLCLPMHYEKTRSFVTSIGWNDPRTKEGELLFPERFPEAEVKALERSLKAWRAAGQLEQRPEPAGGGIIKRDWWQLWPPGGEELDPVTQQPRYQLQYPPMEYLVASLDTAYTENTLNDPSALTVWGVFQGDVVAQHVQTAPGVFQRAYVETSNRVMLCHSWSDHLEIHDLVNRVHKTCQQFKVDVLLIEDKAAGISVAQELRRLFATRANYGIRVMRPIAGGGYTKNSKVARLYSVQNIFEERMVYAPDRPFAEAVIAECGTFPNARRDDLTDTTSQALRYLRDTGILVRGEERMAEAEEQMQHKGKPPGPLYPG